MNNLINLILTRRSVRSFNETPISEKDLELIVSAGLEAPSGMGRRTWKFTVVTNSTQIQKLAAAVGEVLSRENYTFYKPTALIIPSNLKESRWGQEDNACALQNIFLASHALGIGSVWINQLKDICDHEKIRPILNSFEIPEDHTLSGIAALGYPKEKIEPVKRNSPTHFVR
ncbi:MAG TPA: NAD(P)H nitroreductase [Fibrobacter sp.]|nr:NAD(P)H nitroreductase [Fibrobacter sp.]